MESKYPVNLKASRPPVIYSRLGDDIKRYLGRSREIPEISFVLRKPPSFPSVDVLTDWCLDAAHRSQVVFASWDSKLKQMNNDIFLGHKLVETMKNKGYENQEISTGSSK